MDDCESCNACERTLEVGDSFDTVGVYFWATGEFI